MVIITGASDGLGKQIAKIYQTAGKKVVNVARTDSEYADVNIGCDLTKAEDIKEATKKLLKMSEPIKALINCAGVFTKEDLGDITAEELSRVMSTNIEAVILLISSLIERMKIDGTDIVNIVSSAGVKATTEHVYGTSKWALRGFTLGLQAELKNTKCRVISFCPGGMNTGLFEKGNLRIDGQESWMNPEDIAIFVKQILDLPKNMEVSEVIINRKTS